MGIENFSVGRKPLRDMTEPELGRMMNDCARAIERVLPPKTLFVAIAFDGDGIGQYIANVNRSDAVKSLREFADGLESKAEVSRVEFPG